MSFTVHVAAMTAERSIVAVAYGNSNYAIQYFGLCWLIYDVNSVSTA